MEKIAEFLISKIGYTLSVMIFLLFPGIIFVFVWDRELFISMDIIRLIIFSMGISSLLFVVNMLLMYLILILEEKVRKKTINLTEMLIVPMMLTWMEIISAIVKKIEDNNFSALGLIRYTTLFVCIFIVVKIIIEIIYYLARCVRKKK